MNQNPWKDILKDEIASTHKSIIKAINNNHKIYDVKMKFKKYVFLKEVYDKDAKVEIFKEAKKYSVKWGEESLIEINKLNEIMDKYFPE